MDPLNDTPVGFIREWIKEQYKLQYPPTWKGGWERWAQGQIAMFMEDPNGGYQVWTEEKIYKNAPADAVDLEFRKPVGPPGTRTFLELKCYSQMNDDTPATFIERVLEDYDKVQRPLTSGNPSEPSAKGSTLWVVGISQRQFKADIEKAGQNNPKWKQFKSTSAVGKGTTSEPVGTFDLWYWSYKNNN